MAFVEQNVKLFCNKIKLEFFFASAAIFISLLLKNLKVETFFEILKLFSSRSKNFKNQDVEKLRIVILNIISMRPNV